MSLLTGERDYVADVLDAAPTPIVVLSEGLTVVMANDAFWAVSGWPSESGLGRHIDDVTGDIGAGSAVRHALNSGNATVEFSSRAETKLPPFAIGHIPGSGEVVLAGRAAAHAAAARLSDPEAERLRAAFLNHPEPQILVDAAGAVIAGNRAASTLGLEAGRRLREVFAGEKASAAELDGSEWRLQASGGGESTFSIQTRPVGSATLVILRDVGERHRLDERERFLERMAAASKLAGGVSHELNNILTVISSYCHMALDQVAQGASPAADIDAILKAAGDAAQLGNQLIAIGRKHVVQEGPTDLNEVLLGLERTIRGISGDAVRVSITTEARLPAVPIDPRQLERAILAIILHAREAMADGGTITLTSGLVDNRVTLEIADTRKWPGEAVGMQLFEPYASWPTARKHSGLELAVAWCILQQRGAEVSVAREGDDTVVRITFPVSSQQPAAYPIETAELPHRNSEAPAPQPQATVLLVDDNAEIRRAIRHMLEREAYHVIDVGHPLQALRAIEQLSNPIDVLVSDVNMPDMNGRELAQRARELRPGLKVLMISGYADEEIIIGQLFDEGVMFLQKPFSPDRLLKTMRNLLKRNNGA
jgi:CheY-like chemotaxis protein/signal transduction histidine kinase